MTCIQFPFPALIPQVYSLQSYPAAVGQAETTREGGGHFAAACDLASVTMLRER
jgi:hypothetical protein